MSNTRVSAYTAVVIGWTATGNQRRPQVRDAGEVRQMRHVLHVRQVCHVLQPSQVRHVRGARGVRQVRQRTSHHTSGNMSTPHRPCQKTMYNGGGSAIMVSGDPAHSGRYAGTPADPVNSQCKVIAGCPCMTQMLPQRVLCIGF